VTRKTLAAVILLVWAGVLAVHVRRSAFRPEAERLAAAARTLPPGVSYYRLDRGGRHVGWARLEIDTLPGARGFRVRELRQVALPGLGPAGRYEIRLEAWLRPRVALDSLVLLSVRGGDSVRTAARVLGDTLLAIDGAGRRPVDGPLQIPESWPLRFAARAKTGRPGESLATPLFDPVTGTVRELRLEIRADSVLAVPDSADTDPVTGAWIVARRDTVRAWRVTRREGERELSAWVDEDGRIVEAELPAGIRSERTAFQLAFYGWPGAPAAPGRESERSVEER
jgi:hypothetical protein